MMDKNPLKGTVGASCKPLSQMKEDGSFKGNKMMAMKSMMGGDMEKMIKEGMGMKADDKMNGGAEGMNEMMTAGMEGMKGMQEKMGGMDGMMKMMMDAVDTDEGMSMMKGKMVSQMKEMMMAKPDDMEGVQKGMMEKIEGMMKMGMMNIEKGEKGDLLDLMGGSMGMMVLMGMGGGKDSAGVDMSIAFGAMATKWQAEKAEVKADPKAIMEAYIWEDIMKYNDGCDAEGLLCCGQTEEFGVWSNDYRCNTKEVELLNTLAFKCVEGATYVTAGAMSLIAAALMMA